MTTLTVDGRSVTVADGATIREACTEAGVETPALCELNACRLCVVELEGARTLVPSCTRAAEEGMAVRTDSERVRTSRRLVLELLASSVDLSQAPDLLRWLAEYEARPERFDGGARVEHEVKVDNDLYVRDYSKCVLCYRCVDACGERAQNTFAIQIAGRGFEAHVSTEHDVALPDSACVYCGNCVDACPTGALQSKREFDLREAGEWHPERQTVTRTVCGYCGVGCNLDLHVQDGEIVNVSSPALCVKGRFGF